MNTTEATQIAQRHRQRQQDAAWNASRDRPHPYRTHLSGTQCDYCWGWIDDPRHTRRI